MRQNPGQADEQTENEIEITPEMVEAGALVLSRYDPEYEFPEEGAKRILLAMIKNSPAELRLKLGRPRQSFGNQQFAQIATLRR